MNSTETVRDYFDREAERFDAIYSTAKPRLQRIGDRVMRGVISERFNLVVTASGPRGKTFLDVGCGSGRYGVELARRGAATCWGIDIAPAMVDIATKAAGEAGVAERCHWAVGEFLEWSGAPTVDVSTAMGYFDYLENPADHLRRMAELSTDRIFASFPKRWEVRVPIRKARFRYEQGFVRFYSKADVVELFTKIGLAHRVSVTDLGRDYIAICDTAGTSR